MLLQTWIGLNAADAILTGLSVSLGAVELNPFLAAVASSFSIERMLLIKVLLAVALGGAMWRRGKRRILQIMNSAMVAVVMYNALIITYAL